MSTQLKTRPPDAAAVAALGEPAERIVGASFPVPQQQRVSDWQVVLAGIVLVVFSLFAINLLADDAASSPPDHVPTFDSPGGNSLNIP